MSRKSTSFKDSWLREYSWLKKKDSQTAFCNVCKSEFSVSSCGVTAISKHELTKKHASRTSDIKSCAPLVVPVEKQPTVHVEKQSATESELRWTMFLVEHDISLRTSDHVQIIKAICPDSKLAAQMSCGRTKATYLLREGISHEIRTQLISKLKTKDVFFSIMLDESNDKTSRKFLLILVRYFDRKVERVITDIYRLVELPDGKASTLESVLKESFESDELSYGNLLTIMTDSPNVMTGKNTGFLTRMSQTAPHLVDLGHCSLHHVSNAVNYAVRELGEDAEELVDGIFCYFRYTSRWTAYQKVQELIDVEDHRFQRRIPTRWLQLHPVVERVLEQLPVLRHYFKNVALSEKGSSSKSQKILHLSQQIENKSVELDLLFLNNILPCLAKFETLFQKKAPLIHALHAQLTELYKETLIKFVKTEIIAASKKLTDVSYDFHCQLDDKDIFVGTSTRLVLQDIPKAERNLFFLRVRRFYETLVTKLKSYLPLHSVFLRNLSFLQPKTSRNADAFTKKVTKVARNMPTVVGPEHLDNLRDECRLFCLEDVSDFPMDVESFWSRVSSLKSDEGEKFKCLSRLALACLSLPHGNSDSERGFSDLCDIFTKKRNKLQDDVMEALLRAKFHMRNNDRVCHNFSITDEMCVAGRTAHQRYLVRRKEKEEEMKMKDIEERRKREEEARLKRKMVAEFEDERKALEEKEKAADSLLKAYQEAMEKIRKERADLQDKAAVIPSKQMRL